MGVKFGVIAAAVIGCLWAVPLASAQNTGGVFPPNVNAGHESLQYRAAVNPDNAAGDFGFAQRLHYQRAINDDFMWRILGQTRKTNDSDIDLDFIGAELFWEFSENEDSYKHGVRFDARLRADDRAEQLGFNWIHQWNLQHGWSARAVLLTGLQLGETAADGINIQTRTQLAKRLKNNVTIGLENYSNYGNTGNFGRLSEQSHTVGPFISAPIGKTLSVFGGPLFGLTDSAADFEARIWVTQSF
jgi:hypothetical protein